MVPCCLACTKGRPAYGQRAWAWPNKVKAKAKGGRQARAYNAQGARRKGKASMVGEGVAKLPSRSNCALVFLLRVLRVSNGTKRQGQRQMHAKNNSHKRRQVNQLPSLLRPSKASVISHATINQPTVFACSRLSLRIIMQAHGKSKAACAKKSAKTEAEEDMAGAVRSGEE